MSAVELSDKVDSKLNSIPETFGRSSCLEMPPTIQQQRVKNTALFNNSNTSI